MSRTTTRTAVVVAATLLLAAPAGAGRPRVRDRRLDVASHTRTWVIAYRAHDGRARLAYVLLPRWYGPRAHPRIPLVISPHGRGTSGRANAKLWGDLPAIGAFAVVNPDGEGAALGAYSWGAAGQIEDLARMPEIVHRALPWLRIDRRRIYAFGGSMGGQETLLLLAKHPQLLAGAAAFDPVVDLAHQYRRYSRLACNARSRSNSGGADVTGSSSTPVASRSGCCARYDESTTPRRSRRSRGRGRIRPRCARTRGCRSRSPSSA